MKKKLSKIPAKGWFASGGKYHKLQKRGFSLIEVLLSLVVLSFGITAVAVLMVNNIKNLQTSKNQIIALQLAQEGIELVRNLKDNNTAFISKPTAPKVDGSDYSIDKDTSFGDFSSDADAKRLNLTVPPAAIFYTHSGTTATKFFRKIKIYNNYDAGPPIVSQVEVTSYVTWNNVGFVWSAISGKSLDDTGLTAGNCNIANQCVYTESIMPDQN